MQEFQDFKFKIEKIEILHFSISSFSIDKIKSIDSPVFQFTSGFFFNQPDIIGNDVKVEVFVDNSKSENICTLMTRFQYKIKDIEKFIPKDSKEINIPDDLLRELLRFSISTVRGIFFAKTEGTLLKDVHIPPIDISKMEKIKPENTK